MPTLSHDATMIARRLHWNERVIDALLHAATTTDRPDASMASEHLARVLLLQARVGMLHEPERTTVTLDDEDAELLATIARRLYDDACADLSARIDEDTDHALDELRDASRLLAALGVPTPAA